MSGRLQVFKPNQLTENTLSHLPHMVSNDADSFVLVLLVLRCLSLRFPSHLPYN